MSFQGKKLKQLRLKNGYTMESLAKIVNTTKGTISNYENEHSSPSHEMIVILSDVLNTSADFLLGRTEDPSPPKLKNETNKSNLNEVRQRIKNHNINIAMYDGFEIERFEKLTQEQQKFIIDTFNKSIDIFLKEKEKNGKQK